MPWITKKLSVEWVSLKIVWFCEFAGIWQVWGTPISSWFSWLPLTVQILFFFLWCVVQAFVTVFLVIQVFHAFIAKDKHAHVFTNAVVICCFIQIWGFFQSLYLFGAAAALTDGIFLYLYHLNKQNRTKSGIIQTLSQLEQKQRT